MAAGVQPGGEDPLERVFGTASVGIAHVDGAGRFIRVNSAFAAAHLLDPDAFAGRSYREIYEEQGAADLFDELAGSFAGLGGSLEGMTGMALAWRFPHEPTRIHRFDWAVAPVRPAAGETDSAVLVAVESGERATAALIADLGALAAAAVANAEEMRELTESRARVVAGADEALRRIERDLHGGMQQRLVAVALQLRAAQAAMPEELTGVQADLEAVAAALSTAIDDLREAAQRIHPALLAQAGLGPALRTLARRSPVPVALAVSVDGRLSPPIETAAYAVVSEALADAVTRGAGTVRVTVEPLQDRLCVEVVDDGAGAAGGSRDGVVPLADRIAAAGGRLTVGRAPGGEGAVRAELPLTGP